MTQGTKTEHYEDEDGTLCPLSKTPAGPLRDRWCAAGDFIISEAENHWACDCPSQGDCSTNTLQDHQSEGVTEGRTTQQGRRGEEKGSSLKGRIGGRKGERMDWTMEERKERKGGKMKKGKKNGRTERQKEPSLWLSASVQELRVSLEPFWTSGHSFRTRSSEVNSVIGSLNAPKQSPLNMRPVSV